MKERSNLWEIVWWAIALGIAVGSALNSISGFDWFSYYYPQARQVVADQILNPLWIYIILTPIAYLPLRAGYLVFTLLNVSAIWLGSRLTGTHRFLLLLSFPTFWVLWFGQLDGFVMLGVALGLWALQSNRPALVGLSLLLLLTKPHIGGPLAIAYLLWSRNWRTVAVASTGLGLSMIVWGWDWPLIWVNNLLFSTGAVYTSQVINISLFPYSLLFWLVLFVPMARTERVIAIISATVLSIPYAPAYSLISLLVLPVPWWAFVISSAPYIFGANGYWLTMFAPLGCIAWILISRLRVSGWSLSSTKRKQGEMESVVGQE